MRGSLRHLLAAAVLLLLPRLAGAQDTPEQAPARPEGQPSRSLSAAAAGETQVTYHLPKVTYRVDSGFDLDQYLFRASSPIDFTIDLKGFKTDREALLRLRVYDVDMQGAPPRCGPEVDALAVNGVPLGNLTGADSSWSEPTFRIPAGVLNAERNDFTVDIDSTATDCWAVEVDWAEIELPFNLGQVEAFAEGDVDLEDRGGAPIQDPVWLTEFDEKGQLRSPVKNDPIAAAINPTRDFIYGFRIDAWPELPDWEPRVEVTWEIEGTPEQSCEKQTFEAWEDVFLIALPDKVGKYRLRVNLDLYHGDDLLRTEQRTHDLYVTWRDLGLGGVRLPPLQLAEDWAQGQDSVEHILYALTQVEHSNPLSWIYGYRPQGGTDDAEDLIEDGRGRYGDCHTFADVFQILGRSLGVEVGSRLFSPGYIFLTPTRKALDQNASANARNRATGAYDRWCFDNHEMGRDRAFGQAYDPTFGYIGPADLDGLPLVYVYCRLATKELPSQEVACKLLAPPPDSVPFFNQGKDSPTGWSLVEYGEAPAPPQAPARAAATVAASFEGTPTERTEDTDDNGLFDRLLIDAGVRVAQAGSFGLDALLLAPDGRLVALGSLDPNPLRQSPMIAQTLAAGAQTLTVYFPGRTIRGSGIDGPYTVRLRLVAEGGARLDERTFATQAYGHLWFQGLLAEIKTVSDAGVNTDSRPGYDLLRATVQLQMTATGKITVDGVLSAGQTRLGQAVYTARLGIGPQRVELDFPGTAIAASRKDGPYLLDLEVRDSTYGDVARQETAAYRFTDFQPPAAFFDGSARDAGKDADGDGSFDSLEVTVKVGAATPGSYTLRGTLETKDGIFLGTAQAAVAAPAEATLSFDGLAIGRQGVDGPYRVRLSLTGGSGVLAMLDHPTAAYSAASFRRPGATLGSPLSDRGVDTDHDGLFNALQVDVPIAVATAGTYEVRASLLDGSGVFLTSAVARGALSPGSRTLSLSFPGPAIRSHRVDGPYRIVSLDLRVAGGRILDARAGAPATAAYSWSRFQPSGPELTGVTADRGVDANGNGLFDRLVVEIEMVTARAGFYTWNARLRKGDEEIGWAAGRQSLAAGTQRIALEFDGRMIYGKGLDGPYTVEDLAVQSGDQSLSARQAAVTSAYAWTAFERSGVLTGSVTVGGEPLAGATIYATGVGSQRTGASGTYRLPVLSNGTYTLRLQADPDLAPWDITVDGRPAEPGTSVSVPVTVGQTVRVDFESAIVCDEIQPIALHRSTIAGAARGQELKDVLNGPGTGQFGWLSWTGEVSNGSLVRSLTPPGDVGAFANPTDPADHLLSRGDWVSGRVGVQSSRGVRDALDALKGKTIVVPVWEETAGRGANLRYRITGFAQIELTGYELAGPNRISAVFRRTVRCKGR